MKPDVQGLWSVARCPVCRSSVEVSTDEVRCLGCARRYPIIDGIPVFLVDPSAAEHDDLPGIEHRFPDAHKTAQAQHFDHATVEEYEIDRPHGTPRLHRFLIGEKIRRATAPFRGELEGASALTVCGGSGMEAEFLSRMGARVISSDISIGAARRTRERARRFDVDILSIVADIEHLPFGDGALDLVLVHDGLHHLEDPLRGLAEMTRVARRWVSVTEPARAAATTMAVRLGLALAHEESGNRVERMSVRQTAETLADHGYRVLTAERYAMYYRHRPGQLTRALSVPGIFQLVRAMWRTADRVVGRFGNKMVVVGERATPSEGDGRAPGAISAATS